jgi:hypothetical protein
MDITPQDLEPVLKCWLCGGPLRARSSRPWWYKCTPCEMTIRPANVGELLAALSRRVMAAALPPVAADEGCMADGPG